MSGINMVLNTAKQAIASSQIGLNVTGHNISNVNTPSFSRQTAVFEIRDPVQMSRFTMGTGVNVDTIVSSSSFLIEKRLMNQKSELAKYDEAASYMAILESFFNETAETNLSGQISAFWNSWHALSNMPTGYPERLAVYDAGSRLAEQFQWLSDNMRHLETDLVNEVQAGVSQINLIAEQIADINVDIISNSINNNPNDQLDKRNALVHELAQIIDLQTYEQPNGSLTVATNTGHILVYGADTFKLEMRSGLVTWVDSQGGGVDITDRIKGGKLGGWLEMRDEVIPKYRQELDVLAKETIWSVNLQHSRGVGLDFFSSALTGANATDASQMFHTLDFGDRIDYSGEFKMWVENTNVFPPTAPVAVSVDMGVSDAVVDNWAGAVGPPGAFKYKMTVTTGGDVGPAGDDPVISWEKFHPDGSTTGLTGTVTVSDVNTLVGNVDGLTFDISSGTLYEGNAFWLNTDAAGTPSVQLPEQWHWTLSSFAGAFNAASDAVAGGGVGSGYVQATVTADNRLTFTPGAGYRFAFSDAQTQDAGVAAALGFNTFFTGGGAANIAVNSVLNDTDHIAAATINGAGEYGAGDNSNAIAIAEIQYQSLSLAQWTFDRRSADRSGITYNTLEGFYQGMIGTMGIKSAAINRNTEFNRVMVEKIKEQRDAISGVNLDEEMINLMKFQHAFAVASKLLTTADEMMQTLLSVK